MPLRASKWPSECNSLVISRLDDLKSDFDSYNPLKRFCCESKTIRLDNLNTPQSHKKGTFQYGLFINKAYKN